MNTKDTSRYQFDASLLDLWCCADPGGPAHRPVWCVVVDVSTHVVVGCNLLTSVSKEE